MKTVVIILGIALLCLPVAMADENQPADTAVKGKAEAETKAAAESAAPEKKVTLAELLIGGWVMAPTKHVLSGDIAFKDDGTYEKNEKHSDGVGVGIKGEYKLYPDLKPCGIDLCLDKCGGAGSEWTTLFGIVRKLYDGRVEILTSPDQNRPKEFGDKPDEVYTMLLTRRVAEEAKK